MHKCKNLAKTKHLKVCLLGEIITYFAEQYNDLLKTL